MVSPLHSQSTFNGYVSQMRNMFSTSSVALAMVALSDDFVRYKIYIKIIAILVIIFSIIYGYTASRDFENYLTYMEKQDNFTELNILQFKQWRSRILLSYIYIIILIAALILMLKRIV
jgi:hypothetical protein